MPVRCDEAGGLVRNGRSKDCTTGETFAVPRRGNGRDRIKVAICKNGVTVKRGDDLHSDPAGLPRLPRFDNGQTTVARHIGVSTIGIMDTIKQAVLGSYDLGDDMEVGTSTFRKKQAECVKVVYVTVESDLHDWCGHRIHPPVGLFISTWGRPTGTLALKALLSSIVKPAEERARGHEHHVQTEGAVILI